MEQIDFVALARDTFLPDGSVDREKGDRLWAAMFQLPEWLFLMTPRSMEQGQPSAQQIDGKVWYLVFTDGDKLRLYAERNRNLDENGNALFMTMTPDKAVEFAHNCLQLEVFGIRFNEGQAHGWFSPMRNITLFPDYLKNKGLI
ncbi:MAG: hypothetical protein JNJ69_18760 [Leptospiraceae bacterium]|nr:hypothetical protein [Leptospiraceae bacterium]